MPQKKILLCSAYSESEAGYCSCRLRPLEVTSEPLLIQMNFFENILNFGQKVDFLGEILKHFKKFM